MLEVLNVTEELSNFGYKVNVQMIKSSETDDLSGQEIEHVKFNVEYYGSIENNFLGKEDE